MGKARNLNSTKKSLVQVPDFNYACSFLLHFHLIRLFSKTWGEENLGKSRKSLKTRKSCKIKKILEERVNNLFPFFLDFFSLEKYMAKHIADT